MSVDRCDVALLRLRQVECLFVSFGDAQDSLFSLQRELAEVQHSIN